MSEAARKKRNMSLKFLVDGCKFIIKNRHLIRDFLNRTSEYRVIKIDLIKWHCNESAIEIGVYKDSGTHVYLKELTTEALQNAIKELDPDMTISLNEEVK